MHPSPTSEQQELKDAVSRFCREQISVEKLRAWEREPRGIDEASWRAISQLGWFGIGLPESRGGSSLGLIEVSCLLEEAAFGLIPLSVIGAIRGAWALARLDPQGPELSEAALGAITVALALDEAYCREPAHFRTRIADGANGPCVEGEKAYVPNAEHSDYQIVAAREGDGVTLVLVASEPTEMRGVRTFDGDRQAMVEYGEVPVLRRLGGSNALQALRREQTALALAEMVGGMRAVLDMTVAYVKEREQFGQKIALFQAVQHQVADMAMSLTAARHLAWQAICRLASGAEEGITLVAAAAFVGQAFKRLTHAAHHMHGGAGYVVEHPLHFHTERAQSLCIRHTPEGPALAAVADALLGKPR